MDYKHHRISSYTQVLAVVPIQSVQKSSNQQYRMFSFKVLAFACLVALCVALPADDKTKEKKESADLTGAESAQFGYGGIGLGVPIGIGIGGLGGYGGYGGGYGGYGGFGRGIGGGYGGGYGGYGRNYGGYGGYGYGR